MCGQGGHAGVEGASRLETQPPISSSWARWSPHPSCASTEAYRGLMIGIRHAHIEQTVGLTADHRVLAKLRRARWEGNAIGVRYPPAMWNGPENFAVSLVHPNSGCGPCFVASKLGSNSVVSTRSVLMSLTSTAVRRIWSSKWMVPPTSRKKAWLTTPNETPTCDPWDSMCYASPARMSGETWKGCAWRSGISVVSEPKVRKGLNGFSPRPTTGDTYSSPRSTALHETIENNRDEECRPE